ncbi:glucose-6-phosphate dehydrogenase [Miltoncostaea marina]|uniref:glucose-6-phosphate dehydrogenase n=1 Tax=Miltoncostaea marina TaxID=2843215 RepID=UPI001C3D6C9D|nr:glucose-6-phosphate dehydrogenase [Miltoncostaea marina]
MSTAGSDAPALAELAPGDPRLMRTPAPAAIVIFGATGDLTQRKLLPALYSLAAQLLLPPETIIIGAARTVLSDDDFRDRMRAGVEEHGRLPIDRDVWAGFARRLQYVPLPFDDAAAYGRLRAAIEEADEHRGTRGNRLYYLATAPEFFPVIAEQLGRAGLAAEPDDGARFARLVIEKPFGSDLDSARRLNARLSAVFRERQVYRIDHYLGKETVQNLMALRFGNAIFEPIWNRRYVDHVQITVAEDLGIGSRGGYYDRSGALRDIVQNHMMQVLSLVAMEPPARFESRDVRDEKVKVLRAVPAFDAAAAVTDAVRGQYGAGWIAGERVPGYGEERGVEPGSATETFVAMRLTIENWRWSGTPFYLRTGKRLPRRATEVAIQFKPAPHLPFAAGAVEEVQPNVLTLRIQPDEGASLRFVAKVPGPRIDLRVVSMDFAYGSAFLRASPEAYERLLLDALLGDSTLFARWDEVERAWEVVDEVIRCWEDGAAPPPPVYEAGSWGPPAADDLLERDGRRWRRL